MFAGGSDSDYANLTLGANGIITGGLSLIQPADYSGSDLFIKDGNIYADIENNTAAVPEPGSWAFLVAGLLGLGIWRHARD